MMIDPETYYNEYLAGKTAPQLMTVIRGLKQNIGHLKKVMERWEYRYESHTSPNEAVRVWCLQLYLDRAKQALSDAGGNYTPSKAERKASAFDEKIPLISEIVLTVGAYLDLEKTWTYTFSEDSVYRKADTWLMPELSSEDIEFGDLQYKEFLLNELRGLRIGEWRSYYLNTDVLDGWHWRLEIHFRDNSKPAKFSGSNAWPYNFFELTRLLGIDTEEY